MLALPPRALPSGPALDVFLAGPLGVLGTGGTQWLCVFRGAVHFTCDHRKPLPGHPSPCALGKMLVLPERKSTMQER